MSGRSTGLRVKGLTVADGSRWLVRDLDMEVKPGAVHMVLGERDTGKTALLEAVAGLRREERGTVRLGESDNAPPRDRRRGARFLPRECDATQLSTLERLLVGRPPRRLGLAIHGKRAEEHARALAKRVGLEALLDVPVEALRPLERRLIELAAALGESPRALLLDEPTSELGPHEARHFLGVVRAIAREDGIPIVFTSTWARDGYPDAEAVTILRRGEAPVTVSTAEVTESALSERWTGGGFRRAPTGPHSAGDALLRIENIVLRGRGRETSLAGVAFEVRAGEVLAIVGAPADGLNLLHDVLLGHRAPDRGSIQFLGKELAATDRRQRVEAGVSFVSPPHARDQSLGNFTVEENLILGQTRRGPFARRGWLKFESIRGNAVRSLSDFEVPDAKPRDRFGHLSLGAQQRIVIAREVLRDPVLLVARSPAQGLSLEAQEYVRKALVLQCERRSGLLWLSEDPEEALRVADRLAVLAAGRLVWLPVTETLTREAIIDEMSGTAA
ncbi:MAG: ATP-binding cassette domain-containing protein [Candidatus Eisenbacteria bacterium]|uniref:ATP-binding cassette domain-containing protein n=1 Tax=Eiseniibacteriota bacterium TaxID=2212470 RepID=A0A538T590_UNCEI|nr:MAG: ATP-binding cassette domain-containing protein [Candidatus Eisenbacteria bacterium]